MARERLFFALWPSPRLQQQLDRFNRHQSGIEAGRVVTRGNLHLTLAYIGPVERPVRDCLERNAAAIELPPFELVLDSVGHWSGPRVVWLGCGAVPPPLRELVEQLRAAQTACGVEPESRPFAPHVTLRRKVAHLPLSTETFPATAWQVNDFSLVESVSDTAGVIYRVVRRWPLQQTTAG